MARYRIKGIDLAKEMGISTNAVSNLRNSDNMPRIDGDALNNLCNALNKLALGLGEEITPFTLIDYTRDGEPGNVPTSSGSPSSSETKQAKQPKRKASSRTLNSHLENAA